MSEGPEHPGRLALPQIRTLAPYQPGKPISELERELGLHDIAKLASNENAWGPSPAALAAMHAALADVWLYPDGGAFELKQALAAHLQVAPERLTVGNGSSELLLLLAETFLGPEHSAVYSQYAFAIYPLVVHATRARAIEVRACDLESPMPFGHDLSAMAAAVRPDTRMLFIANPNNPTGTWAGAEQVKALLDRIPSETLVVLDEAYVEYGRGHGSADGLPWIGQYPNLVLLRTFSKAYGLAGARVGYAISHPEVAELLDRLRPAFNVNGPAQAGARAALADGSHVSRVVRQTRIELDYLTQGIRALGLWCAPSAANFLLVRVGEATEVYQRLLRAGLITRPLAGYGLLRHLRVSVGLHEQNERLLAALADALPVGSLR